MQLYIGECHAILLYVCTVTTSCSCKAPAESSLVYIRHHGIIATMPELPLIWVMRKLVALHCLLLPHIL